MKRIVSLILCAVLVLGMVPLTQVNAEEVLSEVPSTINNNEKNEIETASISQSGSVIYFSTFDDLKDLASRTYSSRVDAYYQGDTELIISESITLPDLFAIHVDTQSLVVPVGVSFTVSFNAWVDTLVINGYMSSLCYLGIYRAIHINGTLNLPENSLLSLYPSAELTGRENIFGNNYSVFVVFSVTSMDEFDEAILAAIQDDDPHFSYHLKPDTQDASTAFTINYDVTVPENVFIDAQNTGLIVASGCTLNLIGQAAFSDVTVNGVIKNNDRIDIYGTFVFRNDDSYSGVGSIFVWLENSDQTYENVIFGLDFSRFEVIYHSYMHVYQLRDISCEKYGHEYVVLSNGKPATCVDEGYSAIYECTNCGSISGGESIAALGHDWNAATCTSPKTCKRCYTTSGSALGHDWLDATCTAPKTCSICGETSGSALGHSWSAATCTEPKTCTKCNVTSGTALGHSWTAATCTSPKTCSRCSLTSGTALGHNWDSGTVTKQPTESETGIKTYQCTRCTETKTETIPALVHTHSYTSVVTSPTCTQQGYTTFTCACGDSYKSNYTPALGHNYADGICIRCGEADSGYEPPKPTVDGVYRIAGADRIETSIGIADTLKETMGVEKFSNIVVATALNFPDALAGSYLASVKGAPILLTYDAVHAKIAQYIADNLVPGGVVYILGDRTAVSEVFERELSGRGVRYERVAGSDRFGTNMAILNSANVPTGSTVLVCTALNFADSLSVSATGLPILLVYGSLRPDQKVFLNTVKPGAIHVVGGTGAVSEKLFEELKNHAPQVKRVYGQNRHETSATVALEYFPDAKSAVIAYSFNFPDGLCGGPLAYALGAPLLLTVSGDTTPNAYTDKYGISAGYVLGSDSLVNDSSVRSIFHMAAADSIG